MSDDMPYIPDRDCPLDTHVEFCGPFQRTYVLCNGFAVPHLTTSAGDQPDEVMLTLDGRLSFPIPKACVNQVVALVADAIAIERGYGCFPRCPADQDMPKAPEFGPVWHGIDSIDRGANDD